ncbi:MAG: glycosyltransferase [Negativicutes bacterium]|jgi:glycosyltransferase involved in cell wall biosynthesis
MFVSGLVITKNEQQAIGKCLQSMLPFLDEMVLVDTGSTDETVALAQALGADVRYFDWMDDFAAARNFAVSQVKGDWIVFLDADQWFDENSIPKVRALIEQYHNQPDVNMIMVREINHYDATNFADTITGKIYRNRPDIQWVGNIHEMLFFGEQYLSGYLHKEIIIHHYGFAPEKLKDKSGRNLKLLEKNLNAGKITDYLYITLANEYVSFGQWDKAHEFAVLAKKRDIERNQGYTLAVRPPLLILEYMHNNPEKFCAAEIEAEFADVIRRFPDHPEIYYWRALYDERRGNPHAAIANFQKSLRLNSEYSGDQWLDFKWKEPTIYWRLGLLCSQTGNVNQAIEALIQFMRRNKQDVATLKWLMELVSLSGQPPVSIFGAIYDSGNSADVKFLQLHFPELL